VAEGEKLQTNLLQASQRGPASSSVLDEVFGIHKKRSWTHQFVTVSRVPTLTFADTDKTIVGMRLEISRSPVANPSVACAA
jgi:hypothetical protein